MYFPQYFSPQKGTLTDAGDGDGGGMVFFDTLMVFFATLIQRMVFFATLIVYFITLVVYLATLHGELCKP